MAPELLFKESLSTALLANKYRKISTSVAAVMLVLVIVLGLTPFPGQMRNIILILILWFFSSYPFEFLLRKQKDVEALQRLYLAYYLLVDLVFITLIVYYAGGAEWMGSLFFLFPLVYASLALHEEKGILISLAACAYYAGLVALQYFEIIPFKSFYPLGDGVELYKNTSYLLFTVPFVCFAFFFIGRVPSAFTQKFKDRVLDLEQTQLDLKKAKGALEVKVRQRTQRLEDLTKNLEQRVEEKTEELREHIEELQKFKELSVGREMKMIEMKKEMMELKKKLEKE
ncbi:MAG: hypothetical protein GF370_00880 [Candidatus Nealsonbacteria bacterium]|nr:hypothetical protein [Candidatus Nealsonbacteria bacterium]